MGSYKKPGRSHGLLYFHAGRTSVFARLHLGVRRVVIHASDIIAGLQNHPSRFMATQSKRHMAAHAVHTLRWDQTLKS